MSERGIFDGDAPESTTTIFDPLIFDTELTIPVAANPITVFVPGHTDTITTFWHGNQIIPRSII